MRVQRWGGGRSPSSVMPRSSTGPAVMRSASSGSAVAAVVIALLPYPVKWCPWCRHMTTTAGQGATEFTRALAFPDLVEGHRGYGAWHGHRTITQHRH